MMQARARRTTRPFAPTVFALAGALAACTGELSGAEPPPVDGEAVVDAASDARTEVGGGAGADAGKPDGARADAAPGDSALVDARAPDSGRADSGHSDSAAPDSARDSAVDSGSDLGSVDAGDPCAGVTCSGHGTCSAASGSATCECAAGFYPSGLTCAGGTADVSVDWTHVLRAIDDKAYGVDCPACTMPSFTGDPAFLDALHAVTGGTGLVRLHGWGMITAGQPDAWVNADATWNSTKIHDALTPLVAAGYALLIDIPAGPGGDGDVDADRFAAFVAALVKVVNVDHHLGVRYWEIPNEQENHLTSDQMTAFLSKAIASMKAVDPSILVGGPATAWINSGYIASVFGGLSGKLDFVSAHIYGGDGTQPDSASYQSALDVAAPIADLRASLDSLSPGRHVPIFLDEYAIGWNYAPAEYDHRGAVYNLIVQASLVNAGGDASAIWSGVAPTHDMSIVDPGMALRDTAKQFKTLNLFGHGSSVATSVADAKSLFAYATVDAAKGTHLFAVANLTSSDRTVRVETRGFAPTAVSTYRVAADGYTGPTPASWSSLAGSLVVPAESVVMVVSEGP